MGGGGEKTKKQIGGQVSGVRRVVLKKNNKEQPGNWGLEIAD